jgi:predicted Zn-dependent protease
MRARSLLLAIGAFAAASGLHAQFGGFDFGKLNKVVDVVKDNYDDAAKVAKAFAGIGPDEERTIGGSVAVEIVSTYGGLVRDEAMMRRVNLIGRTVADYSDRPDLDWRFGVLNSDTVNAFSAPGGYVFITRGLYALAADDDQLAGILGHEIAHITKRHALKVVARGDFLAGVSGIAARQNSNLANVEAQLQQFDLGIGKIVDGLLKVGFDPKDEYEADHVGRDLAVTAGYSHDSLRLVLQRLQQNNPGRLKQVFSTHPPLAERIKRL